MYNYGNSSYNQVGSLLGGLAIFGIIITLASLALSVLIIISQWKIYKKAGKKGWESIVPVYNMIVLLEIVDLPIWYIALFFVPFANIYAMFKIYIELAHKFGKSTGFGVATVFFSFVCLPILAFGKDNVYNGTKGNNVQNQIPQYDFNNNVFQNEVNNPQNAIQTQQQLNETANQGITQIEPVQNQDFNVQGLTPNNPSMAETVDSIPTMNQIIQPVPTTPVVDNSIQDSELTINPSMENVITNTVENNEMNQTPFTQVEQENMFQNNMPTEPNKIEQNTVTQEIPNVQPQINVVPNMENDMTNNGVNNDMNVTPSVPVETANMFQNNMPTEPIVSEPNKIEQNTVTEEVPSIQPQITVIPNLPKTIQPNQNINNNQNM